MTIEQLQYFYAISVYKTFSQAALEMHISQSALSKQIANLEKELNVTLFDRQHRQVTLTNDGVALLPHAQNILKEYEYMIEHLTTLKAQQQNTIRIAMLPVFFQYDLSYKLKSFMQKHPQIHLIIDEVEERDLQHKLDFHDYDMYILRGKYPVLSAFQSLPLYQDELVAVMSKQHTLAKKPFLSLNDIQNEPLLLPPAYTTIAKTAVQACQKAGFSPHIARHGRLETILTAAKENEGIALMMKKSLHIFHLSNVQIIPFHPSVEAHIYCYYDNHSPHQDAIIQLIDFIHPISSV